MDLSDLRALLKVVEYGSFQRTAQALRSSRSGLRRQIERLEAQLGVELLVRDSKGIVLTTAGQEVVDGAQELLHGAASLVERARARRNDARGILRLIVPIGMPDGVRARALVALRSIHDELAVEVVEVEDPLTRIGEPFDLMIHFGGAPRRDGWYSQTILRVATGLRASAEYLERHGAPEAVEALGAHALAQWSAPGLARGLPLVSGGSVTSSPWLRSANVSLLTRLAESDAAIVYSPVLPAIFGGGAPLVPVLSDVVGGEINIQALAPRPSNEDPKIRALLDNLKRLLMVIRRGASDEAAA